jgi:hypothetical protein
MMHAKWLCGLYGLLVAAVLSTGCASRARAATVPDGPPLSTPPPPARVFVPVEREPVVAGPALPETPTVEAPSAPEEQQPRVARPARSAPPEAPPPSPAPSHEAPRELRAASTPTDAEVEQKVRALLITAQRDLAAVDPGRLTPAGREQYNQAKSFADQATDALAQRNYVFAQTLADKAAQLASALRGR